MKRLPNFLIALILSIFFLSCNSSKNNCPICGIWEIESITPIEDSISEAGLAALMALNIFSERVEIEFDKQNKYYFNGELKGDFAIREEWIFLSPIDEEKDSASYTLSENSLVLISDDGGVKTILKRK